MPGPPRFLAEVAQLLLAQAPFEVGARVDAGRGVSLDEHHVARVLLGGRAPEVIEAHLVERRGRGVAGEVSAVLGGRAIGLQHHRQRVPADVRLDAPLERAVARILRLAPGGDGVDVGGVGLERQVRAAAARVVDEPLEQEVRALRAVRLQHRIDRFEPLPRLHGIEIFKLRRFGHALCSRCARLRTMRRRGRGLTVARVLCRARVRMSNDGEQRQVKQVRSPERQRTRGGAAAAERARSRHRQRCASAAPTRSMPCSRSCRTRRLPRLSATCPRVRAGASSMRVTPARAGAVRTTCSAIAARRSRCSAICRPMPAPSSVSRSPGACSRRPRRGNRRRSDSPPPARPRRRGAALEALLAAALAQAFALPSWRAPARGERPIRRVVLLGDGRIDTRYAAASARGTNLARWLTALPPNMLDARGYRRAIAQPGAHARTGAALARRAARCAAPAPTPSSRSRPATTPAAPASRTCATARRATAAPRIPTWR